MRVEGKPELINLGVKQVYVLCRNFALVVCIYHLRMRVFKINQSCQTEHVHVSQEYLAFEVKRIQNVIYIL